MITILYYSPRDKATQTAYISLDADDLDVALARLRRERVLAVCRETMAIRFFAQDTARELPVAAVSGKSAQVQRTRRDQAPRRCRDEMSEPDDIAYKARGMGRVAGPPLFPGNHVQALIPNPTRASAVSEFQQTHVTAATVSATAAPSRLLT